MSLRYPLVNICALILVTSHCLVDDTRTQERIHLEEQAKRDRNFRSEIQGYLMWQCHLRKNHGTVHCLIGDQSDSCCCAGALPSTYAWIFKAHELSACEKASDICSKQSFKTKLCAECFVQNYCS